MKNIRNFCILLRSASRSFHPSLRCEGQDGGQVVCRFQSSC
ncbi:MAG: hypothetical protein ABIE14_02730 [Patescibacteria group bacterium]